MAPTQSQSGFKWFPLALTLATFLSRVAFLSSPYYVDGPNHVRAIQNGLLFIQPPGYFLFAFSAWVLSQVSHLSAAHAVAAMNVAFSTAGVWAFQKITAELFPGATGRLLACCYAASNVVWFAAEIHSTYASMTFFGPLLFYVLLVRRRLIWGWLIFALLTGFRPSDGVFLLPLMFYVSAKRPWRERLTGLAGASIVCALWYIPTVLHFGGLLAPLSAATRQVGQLPSGLLVHGFTAKGLNNLLHFLLGAVNAWNILGPFVVWGLLFRHPYRRVAALWIIPASLFFALYFVSDSMYLAFLVAPGLILAGFGLQCLNSHRLRSWVALASLIWASVHMLILRPIPARNLPEAVLDSYSLEYTAWGLEHQYAKRLANTVEELNKH